MMTATMVTSCLQHCVRDSFGRTQKFISVAHTQVRVEVVNLHYRDDDDCDDDDEEEEEEEYDDDDDMMIMIIVAMMMILVMMLTSLPVPLWVNLAHSTVRSPHSS